MSRAGRDLEVALNRLGIWTRVEEDEWEAVSQRKVKLTLQPDEAMALTRLLSELEERRAAAGDRPG